MLRALLACLAMTVALGASAKKPQCRPVKEPQAAMDVRDLAPGSYRITFVATNGRCRGRTVTRELELRPTTPEDRSPVTLEQARDHVDLPKPLYGWLSGNLDDVGAPIFDSPPAPSPESQDPVRPGVLVHWDADDAVEPVTITIATLSNLRTGEGWLDGAGIGLHVRQLDASGFAGTWGPWGIVRSCHGRFCAERIGAFPTSTTVPQRPEEAAVIRALLEAGDAPLTTTTGTGCDSGDALLRDYLARLIAYGGLDSAEAESSLRLTCADASPQPMPAEPPPDPEWWTCSLAARSVDPPTGDSWDHELRFRLRKSDLLLDRSSFLCPGQ